MMIFYWLQYLFVFFLSSLSTFKRKAMCFSFASLWIFLVFFAASRSSKVDLDYQAYVNYFVKFMSGFNYFTSNRVIFYEPCFYFIPIIGKTLFNPPYDLYACFTIFACLGVYFKLKSFQLSNSFFLTMLLYGSSYFILHEMTQIRVGIATGILLLSIKPCYNRNLKSFILHILSACFFHYSSIVFFPLYFLKTKSLNKTFWLFMIGLGYFLAIINIDILKLTHLSSYFVKVELYTKAAEAHETHYTINIYNFGIFISIIMSIVMILKHEMLSKFNPYINLILKINVLSIFAFTALSFLPVFAGRLSELFAIVQMLMYPTLIYVFREKFVGYAIVIVISFLNFWNFFYHSKLVFPYSVWW